MAGLDDVVKRMRILHETPGAQEAARKIRDVGAAMKEAATASVAYEKGMSGVEGVINRHLGRELRELKGLLDGTSTSMSVLYSITGKLGLAYAGYQGFSMLVRGAKSAVDAYAEFQAGQVVLENKLIATGHASGRTARQIEQLADRLGNVKETREAAQALVSFRTISGETFDRALKSARDLWASGFGPIATSARTIGQALNNEVDAFNALEQAGIRFGARQRAMIQDMFETGRAAEAQKLVLESLDAAVGGAGARRVETLSGAFAELADTLERTRQITGDIINQSSALVSVVGTLTEMIRLANLVGSGVARLLAGEMGSYSLGSPIMPGRLNNPTYHAANARRASSSDAAFAAENAAAGNAGIVASQARADAVDKVVIALEKEIAALKKSEIEQRIEAEQRRAGVAAMSAEGQMIATLVQQRQKLQQAQKEQQERDRIAVEQAERAERHKTRTIEQIETERERLQARADALWMSETAALALQKADAALAALRESGVPVSIAETREIERRTVALAAQEVQVRRLEQLDALGKDIRFQIDTAQLSDVEQKIAAAMRNIFKLEWKGAMDSAEAELMRLATVGATVRKSILPEMDQYREVFGQYRSLADIMEKVNATGGAQSPLLRDLGLTWEQLARAIAEAKGQVDGFMSSSDKTLAGLELQLRAVTARSPAQRGQIAYEQALLSRGSMSPTAMAEAELSKKLAIRQAEQAIMDAERDRLLSAQHRVETAQQEIEIAGRSTVEQERARAVLQARQQLEQAALQAYGDRDAYDRRHLAALTEQIGKEAQLKQALAEQNLARDVAFERDTALMSSSDQQIASRLRTIYGGEWRAHMNDAIAEQMRFNEALKQTGSILESNLTTGIADVLDGTKSLREGFADTSKAIIRSLEEMAIKLYIIRPLLASLNDGFSNLGITGTESLSNLLGGLFGSADGNVFAAGRVMPFATGGVIDRPILFPMANGMGLAGEAGPEAVMPLRRTPDGRLGVAAAGGAAPARTVSVHAPVTVIAPEPAKFNQSRGQVSRTIGQAWKRAQRYN